MGPKRLIGRRALSTFASILGVADPSAPPSRPVPAPAEPVRRRGIPRHPEREGYVVAVTLIAVVMAIFGTAATLVFVFSPGLRTGCPNCPRGLGVLVSRTPDQTNWTVLFTSVPSGFTPATTFLSISTSGEMALVTSMALSSLTGGMVTTQNGAGQIYMKYTQTNANILSAGDTVWIGTTFAGTTTSTTGCQLRFIASGTVVYYGTLT